jgi:chitinase
VTNCPIGKVTTDIITITTTFCPASAISTASAVSTASPTLYTTSIVYTTRVYTITSCAPTVTNCPARLGQVTTEIIELYTTICPVQAASTAPAPVKIIATYSPGPTTALPSFTTKIAAVAAPTSTTSESIVVQTLLVSVIPTPAAVTSPSAVQLSTTAPAQFKGAASSVRPGGAGSLVAVAVMLAMVGAVVL